MGVTKTKEKAILAATRRLFFRNGYQSTSMDAIAREANVTKQTIYSYFKNKDALFTRFIQLQCEKHAPKMESLLSEETSVKEGLQKIAISFLEMISSKEGVETSKLVLLEAKRRPKLAKLFYETGPLKMNELLSDYLRKKNLKGEIKVENPESASSYFFAMLKGRYHLKLALNIKPAPTKESILEHIDETVQIFCRMFDPKDPLITNDLLF